MAGIDQAETEVCRPNRPMVGDVAGDQGVGQRCRGLDEGGARARQHGDPVEVSAPVTGDPDSAVPERIGCDRIQYRQCGVEVADTANVCLSGFRGTAKRLHIAEVEQVGKGIGGPARRGIEVGVGHRQTHSGAYQPVRPRLRRPTREYPVGGLEEQRVIGDQQIDGRGLDSRDHFLGDLMAHTHHRHLGGRVTELQTHWVPRCRVARIDHIGQSRDDVANDCHAGDRIPALILFCDMSVNIEWEPPDHWNRFDVIESHTGGEPFRVVVNGLPVIPGDTMLERRRYAMTHLDDLRKTLMWEPRGHADMYGGWIGPPVEPDSHLSVLFVHNEGFSTMCGHGIIALTKVAIETGLVVAHAELGIDTPAGQIVAFPAIDQGRVESVRFRNVASFAFDLDASVTVPGMSEIRYDLAYGGAFYAYVRAADVGVDLRNVPQLVSVGRAIKRAIVDDREIAHPVDPQLGFLYGVIFTGPPEDASHHTRNVCVFADGEIDRSPTGTGVSGRLALLHARGEIGRGEDVAIESIVGSVFTGTIFDTTTVGDIAAVIPEVVGSAHIVGRSTLWVDPDDPVNPGFFLR